VRISLEDFEACADDFDRAVEREHGIDRFCSRTEWILPYHRAFLPDRELFLYRDGDSFAAFASREHPSAGAYLEALENMWCFASPLVGDDSLALLDEASAVLQAASEDGRRPPVVLSGIPSSQERGGLLRRVVLGMEDGYELRAVDSTLRFVASLEDGYDGWLARRSAKFRRNLRAADRRADREGVLFEQLQPRTDAEVDAAFRQVLAVEATSWKTAAGSSAGEGSMLAFYTEMFPRLAKRGGLRVVIATRDGEDVGYLHGALTGDHFRGLQMSADAEHAHLGVGNLLQRTMIESLCEEGVQTYDLGTRSEYKKRWAEEGLETLTILAQPA
jgi:hypothetical protein